VVQLHPLHPINLPLLQTSPALVPRTVGIMTHLGFSGSTTLGHTTTIYGQKRHIQSLFRWGDDGNRQKEKNDETNNIKVCHTNTNAQQPGTQHFCQTGDKEKQNYQSLVHYKGFAKKTFQQRDQTTARWSIDRSRVRGMGATNRTAENNGGLRDGTTTKNARQQSFARGFLLLPRRSEDPAPAHTPSFSATRRPSWERSLTATI